MRACEAQDVAKKATAAAAGQSSQPPKKKVKTISNPNKHERKLDSAWKTGGRHFNLATASADVRMGIVCHRNGRPVSKKNACAQCQDQNPLVASPFKVCVTSGQYLNGACTSCCVRDDRTSCIFCNANLRRPPQPSETPLSVSRSRPQKRRKR